MIPPTSSPQSGAKISAWVLISLIVLMGLYAVLWMGAYSTLLPHVYGAESKDAYLRQRMYFVKEYDLPIFRAFIILIAALTVGAAFGFRSLRISLAGLKGLVSLSLLWVGLGYGAAFYMITQSSPVWASVLFYMALLGYLATWAFWPWRNAWYVPLVTTGGILFQGIGSLSQWLTRPRDNLFTIRIFAVILVLTGAATLLSGYPIWPQDKTPSLPYFWPLRFRAEAVYTFSFCVPVIFMLGLLSSAAEWRKGQAGIGAALRGAFSTYGLWLFLFYVANPVPAYFWSAAWPIIPVLIEMVMNRRREFFTGPLLVSILTGIQAALMVVWLQERLHWALWPAHFSMTIYGTFIAGSIICGLALFLTRLTNLLSFAVMQGVVAALMSLALYKLIYYDYRSDLARFWFFVLGVITLMQPFLWMIARAVYGHVASVIIRVPLGLRIWGGQVAAAVFVFGAAFVPDVEALTAHIFMGEYMHHTDTFVMGPLWAYVNGAVIDIDVYSRYGIGTIPFFAGLMKMMGGYTYTHLFTAVVWVTALYFVAVYFFYRKLMGGSLLALTAWMMAFKADIAFDLAYPFVFTYPQSTMARLWPDILWMGSLLMFADTLRLRWLLAAAVSMGFTCWYMPSVGIYMIPGMLSITVMATWRKYSIKGRIWHCLWPFGVVGLTAGTLFLLLCGHWIFTPQFWRNATDFFGLFIVCNSAPLVQSLLNAQYIDVLVFMIIVLTYAATLVKVGWDFLRGNPVSGREWLVFALSLYGLGLLEHYVVLSNANNYYSKVVPFFAVFFYWISRLLSLWPEKSRQRTVFGGVLAAFIAMVTNHSYVSYPNLWNISKDPLVDRRVARPLPDGRPYFFHKDRFTTPPELELPLNNYGDTNDRLYTEFEFPTHAAMIERYHADADYAKDAQLIQQLTSPGEKVALISSYEVRILMQANRKPYFYYFPLITTRAMGVRSLPSDMIDRESDADMTIASLEAGRPEFIFMEKVMNGPIPSAYLTAVPGLLKVLMYVREKYTPYMDGKYLIAMRRKK